MHNTTQNKQKRVANSTTCSTACHTYTAYCILYCISHCMPHSRPYWILHCMTCCITHTHISVTCGAKVSSKSHLPGLSLLGQDTLTTKGRAKNPLKVWDYQNASSTNNPTPPAVVPLAQHFFYIVNPRHPTSPTHPTTNYPTPPYFGIAYTWSDLEMACPVWHSGLTAGQSRDLDWAQRMAMAAIAGRWEASHSGQLRQLGLQALGPRRIKICRTFAERTARDSRHMDMFVQSGARPRKGKLVKTFREPNSRTATHFNSSLPYLTRLLNSD